MFKNRPLELECITLHCTQPTHDLFTVSPVSIQYKHVNILFLKPFSLSVFMYRNSELESSEESSRVGLEVAIICFEEK